MHRLLYFVPVLAALICADASALDPLMGESPNSGTMPQTKPQSGAPSNMPMTPEETDELNAEAIEEPEVPFVPPPPLEMPDPNDPDFYPWGEEPPAPAEEPAPEPGDEEPLPESPPGGLSGSAAGVEAVAIDIADTYLPPDMEIAGANITGAPGAWNGTISIEGDDESLTVSGGETSLEITGMGYDILIEYPVTYDPETFEPIVGTQPNIITVTHPDGSQVEHNMPEGTVTQIRPPLGS